MSALNMKMISILLILVCMDSFTLGTGWKGNHKIRAQPNKKIINTPSAAAPFGPYSQAVVVGNTIYISGQVGINVTSGQLVDGVQAQAEFAIRGIEAILSAAGADLDNVVKVTLVLTDLNNLVSVDVAVRKFFTSKFPASTLIPVPALPLGALVEIDAIAILDPHPHKHSPRPYSRKYRPRPYSRKYRPRPHHRRH